MQAHLLRLCVWAVKVITPKDHSCIVLNFMSAPAKFPNGVVRNKELNFMSASAKFPNGVVCNKEFEWTKNNSYHKKVVEQFKPLDT